MEKKKKKYIDLNERKYHILYETTNLINGKKYVGIHSTDNLDDGYMGSGIIINRALKKWSKDAFERVIINEYDSREDVIVAEMEYVNEEYVARDDTYNIQKGGSASKMKITSEETKIKMSKSRKEWLKNPKNKEQHLQMVKEIHNRESYKEKQSISQKTAQKKRFEDPKARKKISDGNIRRFEDLKERDRASQSSKEIWTRPGHREKVIKAQKEAAKRPEVKKARSEAAKKKWEKYRAGEGPRIKLNEERKASMSKSAECLWKDPEYREKTRNAMKEGWKKHKENMSEEDIKQDHERRSKKAKERWAKARENGTNKLSDEHKRKIAEGGRRYRERIKAEKAAQEKLALENSEDVKSS